MVSAGASALVVGATMEALPRPSAITRNSAPMALSSWVPAVNAGACQGKSVGMPPRENSATGIRSRPLIVIHPNVVASLTPIVAVLRMKYACTPHATQIRIASSSHGPDEPSESPLVMLNSTMAASAVDQTDDGEQRECVRAEAPSPSPR